jgi:heterodisulfide reductase subunit C
MTVTIPQVLFLLLLVTTAVIFARRVMTIRRNILLGRDIDRSDRKGERWMHMARIALGQSKMVARPVSGLLHIIVYVGFIVINLEMLEIVIDGLLGTHRIFAPLLGSAYGLLIGSFEWLAAGVLISCVIFLIRRNVLHIARFRSSEMKGWPKGDANIILATEIVLMSAFLLMNTADSLLHPEFSFALSGQLQGLLAGMSEAGLHMVERGAWWVHIIGVMAFLVYVTYSKHLHILLAFPNTWYANLEPSGKMDNMAAVKKEVDMMMDPNVDPYATPPPADGDAGEPALPATFGARDVKDLSWKQLMEGYSCTECGRCTSVCPANLTGKLLSPRKIMMDTRDRLEEVGKALDSAGLKGEEVKNWDGDGKSLLGDYISEEELWACTSCQACVEACPLTIDPMGIILDLRRNLIMEDSKAPEPITSMFNNVENNGAPWAFPAADRGKWVDQLNNENK